MSIRDRLHRLENKFCDEGPSLGHVSASFVRVAGYARAKLCGIFVDEEYAARDEDTIRRWQRAEGIDLQVKAERARHKLLNVR